VTPLRVDRFRRRGDRRPRPGLRPPSGPLPLRAHPRRRPRPRDRPGRRRPLLLPPLRPRDRRSLPPPGLRVGALARAGGGGEGGPPRRHRRRRPRRRGEHPGAPRPPRPPSATLVRRLLRPPRVGRPLPPPRTGLPAMKTALITGITGQDGSYLAELLLEK